MAKNSLVVPSSAVLRRAVSVTRSRLDRAKIARGVLLLAMLLAVAAGMFQFSTPPVAPLTASPTESSAARAMQHLQMIAREPHPIGSAANERVRDYLVAQLRALGLDPEVQITTAGHDEYFGARLGTVQNVIARLKGTQAGKGIMLAAHFLGAQPRRRLFEIVPGLMVEALTAKAPAVAVALPDMSVVDDTTTGDIRRLRLRVTSPRRPWMTTLTAKAEGGIGGVTVGGRRFDLMERPMEERQTWSLSYVALPAEGVELALDLMPGEPLTLVVSDTTHGLPQIPGTTFLERPSDSMAAPVDMTDAAIVTKTFRY